MQNLHDQSILYVAAIAGHSDCTAVILKYNPDINMEKVGLSALHLACHSGDMKSVRLLLDYGATVSFSSIDGDTALHCAAKNNHEKIVRTLVKFYN